MSNPFAIAAVLLVASVVFSALGKQITKYGNGKKSYLAVFVGRPILTMIAVIAISAVGSFLITLINDETIGFFLTIFAAFLVFFGFAAYFLRIRPKRL